MNRKGNILVVVLALVALASLSLAGYFYWQNQRFQKPKVENIVAPIPTPVAKQNQTNSTVVVFIPPLDTDITPNKR